MQTTAAGGTTSIQVPSSGSILRYSTVDGSVGPEWVILDSGELLAGSSALAAGTSGQYLQTTGGVPAWVGISSHSILTGDADQKTTHVAAPGSSGALLRTGATSLMEWLPAGTSGQILEIEGGLPAWTTPPRESFRLRSSVSLELTTGTWNALNWTTEDIDTNDAHSTATNTSIVVIPTSGVWLIGFSAQALVASSGAVNFGAIAHDTTAGIIIFRESDIGQGGSAEISLSGIFNFTSANSTIIAMWFPSSLDSTIRSDGEYTPVFWGHRLS